MINSQKKLPIKVSKSCCFIFKFAEKLLHFEKQVAEKLQVALEVGFIAVKIVFSFLNKISLINKT